LTKKKDYLKRTDSKNVVRSFVLNQTEATVFPDFSFAAVEELINNDPVARGAINHFVDKCVEGEYYIVSRDEKERDDRAKLILDEKHQFGTNILRKAFLLGKLFNNVFIEIVRDTDGKTKALNILDSGNIDAITKPNGDPRLYKSKIKNPKTGVTPTWEPKDVVWIRFGDRSKGYAPVDLRAVWENLLMKDYIKRYVAWLWQTGQYRLVYGFKNSSDSDIEDFVAFNKKHDTNFKQPFLIKGEFETKMLRDMKETESFVELLKYIDGQTLILLRVPPIDAGIPDASGRSNSDAQSNNFASHVVAAKKVVEDAVNFDLFPKMNKSTSLLAFGPTDRFSRKQVFETVQIMKSLNMTDEAVTEYLKDSGLFWETKKLFQDPADLFDNVPSSNPRDKDMAPSRKGLGEGEAQDVKGTGAESSTRDDQIKRS
jgi:hypothetical protein